MKDSSKNFPLMHLLEKGRGTAINNGPEPLTYDNLRKTVLRIGKQLASIKIKPGDAVGIVTPNGPEAATIFISVASFATAAPLNPSYTKEEFKFYLKDLDAKILIILENNPTDAISAAKELGIKIVAIRPKKLSGDITLTCDGVVLKTLTETHNKLNDISLILHTSGTTSHPKIVPLTAENICVSAQNIAKTLKLTNQDCYLNIMPLFHIHGLIAGVLTTLESGGTMFCSTGFDTMKFYSLLKDVKPTWFSAVPTMHQAILTRANRNAEIINANNLKFIRSSSASLPVVVLEELEAVFNCPVIEAYGMTEAAHQMASNPLPPKKKKSGTVGIPSGPLIQILSNDGKPASPNSIGEIVIKGKNVMHGYKNNPLANKENFTDGWFRTGDQGLIDNDGFLTITGRIKEIINRGGEKISPKEIDDVLISHPNVAQAVSFSIAHEKLGEDIGAALVLVDGLNTDKTEIRDYLKTKIASFKIPRTIVFLNEIPKSSTGKVQRIGLAKKLGITK